MSQDDERRGCDAQLSTAEDEASELAAVRDALATMADFEHRRIFAAINKRLFNQGELLSIGRFRAIRLLGVGGIGEVYLCDDETLGRKVAVKRVTDRASEQLQVRLRREAQALAQLSHPNVVQVYELGVHEDRNFVAMEYVEGQTLRDWLLEARPTTRAIVARFLAAGRGLAAVHAAGLVHRDFKPDNVLIATDGEVRVVDFGLALLDAAEPGVAATDGGATRATDRGGTQPASRLTAVGSLLGTVLYMPLEQLRGETVDARSDQFSFCMALYEALWRRSAYPGAGVEERAASLAGGNPIVPKDRRRLFRVIRRGLSLDPAQRWPDMPTLLEALARAEARPRRLVAGVGLAAGLGVLLGLSSLFAAPGPSCSASLDGIWDSQVRARVEDHVAGLDAGHVDESRRRLLADLDGWAGGWNRARAGVCDELEGARSWQAREREVCLMRQARQVESLTQVVLEGDADTLARAVVAVVRLPEPAACTSTSTSAQVGVDAPPPMLADVIEQQRAQLARARALRLLGRSDDAKTLAAAVEVRARGWRYPPLLAEARAELGKAEDEGGDPRRAAASYDDAYGIAFVAHMDELAAEIAVERLELSLFELDDWAGARRALDRVALDLERAGADAQAWSRVDYLRGYVAKHEGDLEGARRAYGSALARAGATAPERPNYLSALARVTADPGEALELWSQALASACERFGERHPRTAKHWFNFGLALSQAGAGGQRELARAIEIWGQSSVPLRFQAEVEMTLSQWALQAGDFATARAHAHATAAILAELLPASSPRHGEPEHQLATIAAVEQQHEEALIHARRALEHYQPGGDDRAEAVAQLIEQLAARSELLSHARRLADRR